MLHQIAVDRVWRCSGIGSALIDEMKARLRGQGIVRVRTVYAAFNTPSAALMRKAGFEPFHITAEGPA
jgi:N-acetylglutamate synthase-like GNAT family acetyltransferase